MRGKIGRAEKRSSFRANCAIGYNKPSRKTFQNGPERTSISLLRGQLKRALVGISERHAAVLYHTGECPTIVAILTSWACSIFKFLTPHGNIICERYKHTILNSECEDANKCVIASARCTFPDKNLDTIHANSQIPRGFHYFAVLMVTNLNEILARHQICLILVANNFLSNRVGWVANLSVHILEKYTTLRRPFRFPWDFLPIWLNQGKV